MTGRAHGKHDLKPSIAKASEDTRDDHARPVYGLSREAPGPRRGGGWTVNLRRSGRRIARLFKDSVYSSSEAARAEALAYREAVIAAIPPRTNREQAIKIRRNNKTGVSGVRRGDDASGVYWQATLQTRAGQKSRHFSVVEHGEDGAEALALEQRRRWLAGLAPAYLAFDPHGDAVTHERFGDLLDADAEIDVHERKAPSTAEIEARLAEVDAAFDAARPPRLRVRVKQYAANEMAVAVSDAGRPARRSLTHIRARGRPLPELLAEAGSWIAEKVGERYGPDTARSFMRGPGDALLDPDRFDPAVGVNVCIWLPPSARPSGTHECIRASIRILRCTGVKRAFCSFP